MCSPFFMRRKNERGFIVSAALAVQSVTAKRTSAVRRVLWVILLLNLMVAAVKYIYGSINASASMQADGIHSAFDSAGNIVGLLGITLAARPADENHPYGHTKFETYASICIGVLLLFAAFEVGVSAVHKLMTQSYTAQVNVFSFFIMIITLFVNISVTVYERRQGKLLRSEILSADAAHTLSDAFVSLGVIVGLVLVSLGFPAADPFMALIVTLAILITAYDVFKRALSTLSDHARISEVEVRKAALCVSGVRDAHRIRTRGTEGEVYADLHVLVAPDMTVSVAHEVANEVENSLRRRFSNVVDVLVHIEPDDGHRE